MNVRKYGTCLLFAFFAVLAACSQGNQDVNPVSRAEVDEVKGALQLLQSRQGSVESLLSEFDSLKNTVQSEKDKQQRLMEAVDNTLSGLTTDVAAVKQAERDRYKAVLDLKSRVYTPVATPSGSFLLVVEGVEATRDGSTVSLLVGNPLAAAVKGFKLNASWGGRPPEAAANAAPSAASQVFGQWEKSLLKKEFAFPDRLESGKWNKITVDLEKYAPRELGYLSIVLEPQEIVLQR